jgi:hypothetical protein
MMWLEQWKRHGTCRTWRDHRKWISPLVCAWRRLVCDAKAETSRFRGSDDDLRARFEEYICAALASLKLEDFVRKGKQGDIAIVGIGQLCPTFF